MRTCLPLKGYVHYFQVNHALRNFNFCDVTYFLAKQTLCNRGWVTTTRILLLLIKKMQQ